MAPGRLDVHAHYVGGSVAELMRTIEIPGGFTLSSWSVDKALDFMDRHDIGTQVLSVPTHVSSGSATEVTAFARSVNEELAAVVADHPDRFGAFAQVPLWDADTAVTEIRFALDELGLDGVELPSNAQGCYLGQDWFEPVLVELGRRGTPTFVHPVDCKGIAELGFGRPSSVFEYPTDTARNVLNAIYSGAFRRHPGLRLILAHAGGTLPTLAWRISAHLANGRGPHDDPGVTKEHIAQVLRGLYYDTAISPGPHSLLPLLQCTSARHIFYGSDWPAAPEYAVVDADTEFAAFTGLTDEEKTRIRRANAEQLFPRLTSTSPTAGSV